jgi:hypothetical protein
VEGSGAVGSLCSWAAKPEPETSAAPYRIHAGLGGGDPGGGGGGAEPAAGAEAAGGALYPGGGGGGDA